LFRYGRGHLRTRVIARHRRSGNRRRLNGWASIDTRHHRKCGGQMTEQQNQQPESAPTPDTRPSAPGAGAPAPTPRPTPATIPPPSALPKPSVPVPAAPPSTTDAAEPALDPADVAEARKFGKVDGEGNVSVVEAAGERVVGQYPGVSEEEALSLYVRRYLDLKAQVALFETRLPGLSARDLDTGLAALDDSLKEPAAVGDLDTLRGKVDELRGKVAERKETLAAELEAAKAEGLALTDPASTQCSKLGDRPRSLLDVCKHAQRTGARIDTPTEDGLWKRFSAARTTFDRGRRQFFAELDRKHAEAKAIKEKLIERAEALQNSTDWGPTSGAYRQLMDEWKAAGRASRKDDDALWARFRAAQDVFFEARQGHNEALDAEFEENLKVKLALLEEAERLVPVKDLERT